VHESDRRDVRRAAEGAYERDAIGDPLDDGTLMGPLVDEPP
jgi:acyl-CoA reductase-like NAD-dependent aldehyde dehydrogenase